MKQFLPAVCADMVGLHCRVVSELMSAALGRNERSVPTANGHSGRQARLE